MNHSIIKLTATILLFLSLTSCNKDEVVAPPSPVNPITSLRTDANIEISGTHDNPNWYNMGFEFTPKTDGKITELGLFLPVNGFYEVRVYNATTHLQLNSVFVASVANDRVMEKLNAPISVLGGQKYAISVWTNQYFSFERPDNAAFMPMDMEDMTINRTIFSAPNVLAYPNFSAYSARAIGVPEFRFVPNS